MKKIMLLLLILLASSAVSAVNISVISYQAYFAVNKEPRLALVKYNDSYLYLVEGDIIAENLEVRELTADYLLLFDLQSKREHRINIAQTEEAPSPQRSSSRTRDTAQTPRTRTFQPAGTESSGKTPEIYLEPQNFNITWANARATLIIMARGFEDLYSIALNVSYDPALAVVDDINEGYLLKSKGGSTDFKADISEGSLDIEITRLDDSGVSGNGMVASIIFRPLESGTTNFDINNITVYDSSFSPIEVDITNSVVNIQIPQIDPEQEKLNEEMLKSDDIRKEIGFPGDFDKELPFDKKEERQSLPPDRK